MNVDDFYDLITFSKIIADPDSGIIDFYAYEGKADIIEKLITENHLENITISQFQNLSERYMPQIKAIKKLRENKINDFISMSPKNIAQLPLEKKVEILETIFHKRLTKGELLNICYNNKEELKTLLYNIKFPKEFWEKEEKQADRFAALVANNKKITDSMKNWDNLNIEEKKATIKETAKIINYAYHTSLEIGFYTSEEFRKSHNLDENHPVYTAYQQYGKIFFNTDRLEKCDNYTGVSVLFHEFMHKRQFEEKFDNPLINRLFNDNIYSASCYEEHAIDKNSKEFGDMYSLMPAEIHAYTMQKYVEDNISDKTGIEKTLICGVNYAKMVHNKVFAMANITKARSMEK